MSSEPRSLRAPSAGRADKIMRVAYPHATRSQLRELFASGGVRRAGKPLRKGDFVAAGELIDVAPLPESVDDWRPLPDDAPGVVVVQESEEFVALCKPAGMHSHPLKPGELGCAANIIAARYPECLDAGDNPREGGLIHRLDRGTSGILVFARTQSAWLRGRDALRTKQAQKTYLALTHAEAEDGDSSLPIENGSPRVTSSTSGQEAHTSWSIVAKNRSGSLLRVTSSSGRRHQIRFHLASAGLAILGDTLYNGMPAPPALVEFFLHAESLSFPGFQCPSAPLPPDRNTVLAALGLPEL